MYVCAHLRAAQRASQRLIPQKERISGNDRTATKRRLKPMAQRQQQDNSNKNNSNSNNDSASESTQNDNSRQKTALNPKGAVNCMEFNAEQQEGTN